MAILQWGSPNNPIGSDVQGALDRIRAEKFQREQTALANDRARVQMMQDQQRLGLAREQMAAQEKQRQDYLSLRKEEMGKVEGLQKENMRAQRISEANTYEKYNLDASSAERAADADIVSMNRLQKDWFKAEQLAASEESGMQQGTVAQRSPSRRIADDLKRELQFLHDNFNEKYGKFGIFVQARSDKSGYERTPAVYVDYDIETGRMTKRVGMDGIPHYWPETPPSTLPQAPGQPVPQAGPSLPTQQVQPQTGGGLPTFWDKNVLPPPTSKYQPQFMPHYWPEQQPVAIPERQQVQQAPASLPQAVSQPQVQAPARVFLNEQPTNQVVVEQQPVMDVMQSSNAVPQAPAEPYPSPVASLPGRPVSPPVIPREQLSANQRFNRWVDNRIVVPTTQYMLGDKYWNHFFSPNEMPLWDRVFYNTSTGTPDYNPFAAMRNWAPRNTP